MGAETSYPDHPVAVVDDEVDFLRVVRRTLGAAGITHVQTYADGRELIFDGYRGNVGGLVTASIHVGTATHHLEMTCDDVPDDWYMLAFVLYPEG